MARWKKLGKPLSSRVFDDDDDDDHDYDDDDDDDGHDTKYRKTN